ncbi:MAG: CGGC domain-containing protein [Deltaproteobacteria bacterium]|nr:CGGC domain-containing protein [Deltaproteobacteria bacterium]
MANVAVMYCRKLKDYLCIACTRCFEAAHEKTGDFAGYDAVNLVAMTDCGDCPGMPTSRVELLMKDAQNRARTIDAVHFGSCMKAAIEVAKCPIRFEETKRELEGRFPGLRVVMGTHGGSHGSTDGCS